MGLHPIPRCFQCQETVETDRVYAAPCDHDTCGSAVFHPLCLMEWREHREARLRQLQRFIEKHMGVMRPDPEET